MQKEYVGEVFKGIALKDQPIMSAVFEDCVFENCLLDGLDISGCRFTGCRFTETQLLNLKFDRVQAISNDFERCTLSSMIGIRKMKTKG